VVNRVLRTGPAPSARDRQLVDILNDWVRRDAPLVDADDDGLYDEPGPVIMDGVWGPIADAVMRPQFGDLVSRLSLGGDGPSYVDKDLRTLLGDDVEDPFELSYCGGGDLDACSASLWAVIDAQALVLADQNGPDPTEWRSEAARTSFIPELIPETMRRTNRPTYQQVLELVGP
jgi:hypothetical protein